MIGGDVLVIVVNAVPPRARCAVRAELQGGARECVSVSTLSRHIHSVKKRIRFFEECFEQERHYRVREKVKDSSCCCDHRMVLPLVLTVGDTSGL